jgi:hypothetical protein
MHMLSQSRKAAILEKFAQDQLMAGQKPPPPPAPVKSTSTLDSTGQVDPVTGRTFGGPAKKFIPSTTGAAPVKSTSTLDSTGQVDPVTGRTFGGPAKKFIPSTTGAAPKAAPAAKPAGGLEDWERPVGKLNL